MKTLLDTNREWQFIRDPVKLSYLVEEKLKAIPLFLKGTHPPAEFRNDGKVTDGFQFAHAPEISMGETVTLYTTRNRQVEIDFQRAHGVEDGVSILVPVEARIGAKDRSTSRFRVEDSQVIASNFQISRSDAALDNTRPLVTFQVIFREMEKDLSEKYPGIRIYEFADKDRPPETRYLNRRSGTILIEDTGTQDSYRAKGPEFADAFEIFSEEESLSSAIRRYQEAHIRSIMVMPVRVPGPDKPITIAFIYAESRGENSFGESDFLVWKEASLQLLQRIEDVNTIRIKDKQRVINVSEGGVALEFTHPDLVKNIPLRSNVTFDLIFKMQAPLRFHGRICYARESENGVVSGIDLMGTGHYDTRTDPRQRLKTYVHELAG